MQAFDLKINEKPAGRPFISYEFYTFEHKTITYNQESPILRNEKQFQTANNSHFETYMRNQKLRIELFDDSVPLGVQGQNDHIGTAEIPLASIYEGQSFDQRVPVLNRNGQSCGEIEVAISCFDLPQAEISQYG